MENATPPKDFTPDELLGKQYAAAALARIHADLQQKMDMPCPDGKTFAAYASQALADKAEVAFLEHIDACPICRLRLMQLGPAEENMLSDLAGNKEIREALLHRLELKQSSKKTATKVTFFAALAACFLFFVYSPTLKKETDDMLFITITQEISSLPKSRGRAEAWIAVGAATEKLEAVRQGYFYEKQRGAPPSSNEAGKKMPPQDALFSAGRLLFATETFCLHGDPIQIRHWKMLQTAWQDSKIPDASLNLLNSALSQEYPPPCDGLRAMVRETLRKE